MSGSNTHMMLQTTPKVLRVPSGRKYAGSRSKIAFDETEDGLDVKETSKAKDVNALGTSVTIVGQSVHDCGSVGSSAHRNGYVLCTNRCASSRKPCRRDGDIEPMPVMELSRKRHLRVRTTSDFKRPSKPRLFGKDSQGTEGVIRASTAKMKCRR